MSKLKVLPYKSFSKSAKEVVRSLGIMAVLKKHNTPLKGKKLLLNWGSSSISFGLTGATVLNRPEAVVRASDKLTALRIMQEAGVRVPEFSTDIAKAREWIDDGKIALCRTLLRANSGRGIKVCKTAAELITAPLYVKYIRKEKEYRVHVFNGQVIDLVEKRRRQNFDSNPVYNKYIRSYEQGWIMARDGVAVSDATKAEAIKAVRALGLDFGAVDIVMDRNGAPVVLECNTAPGIQGTTLANYKKAIETWMRGR